MVRRGWRRAAVDDRAQLVDVPPAPDPFLVLQRVVAEAVILQDEAEAVLASVAQHDHLGYVAPRAGPVVRRFFALRDELPGRGDADPELGRLVATLDTIFYHHAMQVATALEFLASEGRSELMYRQVSAIGGLGAPARLLDDLWADLRHRAAG